MGNTSVMILIITIERPKTPEYAMIATANYEA